MEKIKSDLQSKGILCSNNWLKQCLQNIENNKNVLCTKNKSIIDQVLHIFMYTDIYETVSDDSSLPLNINQLHKVRLFMEICRVLQIDEVIDIGSSTMKSIHDTTTATTQEDETSNKSFDNNQLFKLYLSDGKNKVVGIDMYGMFSNIYRTYCQKSNNVLYHNFFAGSKIVVKNILVLRGALILSPDSVSFLGGIVDRLETLCLPVSKQPQQQQQLSIGTNDNIVIPNSSNNSSSNNNMQNNTIFNSNLINSSRSNSNVQTNTVYKSNAVSNINIHPDYHNNNNMHNNIVYNDNNKNNINNSHNNSSNNDNVSNTTTDIEINNNKQDITIITQDIISNLISNDLLHKDLLPLHSIEQNIHDIFYNDDIIIPINDNSLSVNDIELTNPHLSNSHFSTSIHNMNNNNINIENIKFQKNISPTISMKDIIMSPIHSIYSNNNNQNNFNSYNIQAAVPMQDTTIEPLRFWKDIITYSINNINIQTSFCYRIKGLATGLKKFKTKSLHTDNVLNNNNITNINNNSIKCNHAFDVILYFEDGFHKLQVKVSSDLIEKYLDISADEYNAILKTCSKSMAKQYKLEFQKRFRHFHGIFWVYHNVIDENILSYEDILNNLDYDENLIHMTILDYAHIDLKQLCTSIISQFL